MIEFVNSGIIFGKLISKRGSVTVVKATVIAWFHGVSRIVRNFHPDVMASYAAGATLFIIISFFPFIMLLLSILRFLPDNAATLEYISLDFVPDIIKQLLLTVIEEIAENTSTVVIPLAAISGLWSASTGFVSVSRGLNAIYNRKEGRAFLVVRGLWIAYTMLFLIVLTAVLGLLVFGRSILSWLETTTPFLSSEFKLINLRFIVAFILLLVFFISLYKTIPDRKSRWFAEIPGALFSAVAWIVFSHLYSWYISGIERFSKVYGSLTAVVLLMIWLYICIYILFVGAYINRLLTQSRVSAYLLKTEENEEGESTDE